MTAYGRAHFSNELGRFGAEIQSVNRKYLELQLFLPKELSRFEPDLRKLISETVFRGQITIKISAYFEKTLPLTVTPNLVLAKQLKEAWDQIAQQLSIESPFNLELLAREKDILVYGDEIKNEEEYRSALFRTVQLALNDFLAMRLREGSALQRDIADRLVKMRQWVNSIAGRSQNATERQRQKLLERIEEVLGKSIENEERVLREVALYAERIDIMEEITRLHSHFNQAEELLRSDDASVGKTFEFVLQEMLREINTIGSKSSDVEISRLVIDCKSELERIREQIQNVE